MAKFVKIAQGLREIDANILKGKLLSEGLHPEILLDTIQQAYVSEMAANSAARYFVVLVPENEIELAKTLRGSPNYLLTSLVCSSEARQT